jgi:phage baseplate assembly protein W
MKSLAFPNMFSSKHVQTVSDRDATMQNMKLFLSSEKGSFKFDPFFGIRLKRYMFEQNNSVLRDILVDEIYEQLEIFMPQLIVKRSDIQVTSDRNKIYCTIKARNQLDFQLNTYNLVLMGEEE